MARLDHWSEPRRFGLITTWDEPFQGNPALHKLREHAPQRIEAPPSWGTLGSIIGTARELILRVENGKAILSIIGIALDEQYFELVVQHMIETVDADEDEIKWNLALAAIFEVPVYPNDDLAAEMLVKLHTELFTSGFAREDAGETKRYRLNVRRAVEFRGEELLDSVTHASAGPAEVLILRAQAARRATEAVEAGQVLARLRAAIDELTRLLETSTRDEGALQRCLTSYPTLFGLDYARSIPKHSLGGEYEVDFALQRHSGLVDLVEIEASTLPLYTKAGDPRAHLVHAEQQVLDWLDWVDRHREFARSKLRGLVAPRGFVVIGTTRGMSEADRRRLERRNISWNGRLEVHTYESLLSRAQSILSALVR